jgi:soluble lytic murein transglycosylase-like protein
VTPVANAAASKPPATVARITPCPFPTALRRAFEVAAVDASIPPAMLWAVAKVESNLHEDAESSAGARGLLQVMPATAAALDLNVDEPSSNVLAGARYLRQMLDRFHSSDLALAAYNAGPTAVTIAGGAPSLDVQRYVSNVNQLWHSVAGCR